MRTLRLWLVGLLVPALFAGLSVAAAAEGDDQEGPTATYVTGVSVPTPEEVVQEGDVYVGEIDWSDPRLPSRMLARFNAEGAQGIHPDGYGVTARITGSVRLEGLAGSWSGTLHSLAWTLVPESGEASQDSRIELLVLEGEGDYEGLSATLTGPGEGEEAAFEGFIFDNTLTMPDPIEPTTE